MKKTLLSLLAAGLVATVASPLHATDYEKVTSLEQVTDGDYLIACPEKGVVMGEYKGDTSAYFAAVTVDGLTAESTTIAGQDDFTVVTIKKVEGGYELLSDVKHFTTKANKKLTLVLEDVVGAITEENGVLKIFANPNSTVATAKTAYIQYNASSPRFTAYSSAQTPVTLFKEVGEGGGTVTPDPDPEPEPTPELPEEGVYFYELPNKAITTAAGEVTYENVTWAFPAVPYVGFDSSTGRGVQLGSSKNAASVWSLTTDAFAERVIKQVKVEAATAKNGNFGIVVKVNGKAYKYDEGETPADTAFVTSTTSVISAFEGSDKGTLEIEFTNKTTNVAMYIKSIEVTYGNENTPVLETVELPVFTPAAGEVEAGTKVTISCATEGASLFYALGDAEFAPYTAETEIVINEAATVRAKATKEGMNDSQVASAAYTIKVVINPDDLEGAGTAEKPYTVADVITLNNTKKENAWVSGYIVGYLHSKDNSLRLDFENTDTVNVANIVLAPVAEVTDSAMVIPVQLPAGAVRDALNLNTNRDNLGKKVEVYGKLEMYFSMPGVKSVSDYNLEGAAKPEYPTVENIGEWLDEQPANYMTILQPVTVVYQNGLNLLIQDATGSLLVYGNIGDRTYENGDQLSGIAGKLYAFHSLPQFDPVVATFGEPVGKTDAVKPAESTLADVNAANIAKYVSVAGVSIVEEDGKFYAVSAEGDAKIEIYNRFKVENLAAGSNATIVGFVWVFDTTMEIVPTEIIMEQTGIAEITAEAAAAGQVYDLMGRRLAAPARGLYIVNGKKVLVK